MIKIKQWMKSWTINFGLLLQIAAGVQLYVDGLGNPAATMVVGVIIILLRFKTTKGLDKK